MKFHKKGGEKIIIIITGKKKKKNGGGGMGGKNEEKKVAPTASSELPRRAAAHPRSAAERSYSQTRGVGHGAGQEEGSTAAPGPAPAAKRGAREPPPGWAHGAGSARRERGAARAGPPRRASLRREGRKKRKVFRSPLAAACGCRFAENRRFGYVPFAPSACSLPSYFNF